MSLKQTYQSRKQLLVQNLETMGVTGYDEDDGLTTLINAVLEISPSPTPTVDSLTLAKTAGKQILSYADKTSGSGNTEYCTVTATALDSNNQGVSGQSVVFKVGTTTVATETTDSNGEASYTYTSQGSGDVVLSAECSSLIQTYGVYDYLKYDDCSTDKTSNYSKSTGASFSFNTDHYELGGTNVSADVLSTLDNVRFEVLLKHNNNAGGIMVEQSFSTYDDNAFGLYNNASNSTYLAKFPWQNVKSQNNVTNNTDYYRYILEVSGDNITATIENSSGTSLFTGTTSMSLSAKHYCLFTPANTMNIKEIIVKPL